MAMTRFEEEIQALMLNPAPVDSPALTETSFTALLGLASNHSLDFLHETLASPIGCCPPIFPADVKLVERAARLSVFSGEESPEVSNSGQISPAKIKTETKGRAVGNKRKGSDKNKLKVSTKKSKKAEENNGGEKLPFVHVRVRSGQATDSHSLAERARREKINGRMKLLQELVPGCSKMTGTALVLDEIINHVQSLQRQVEFLSMRLAAVYPTMDFNELDSFLTTECGGALAYMDGVVNGGKQQQQQRMWIVNSQQQRMWERDDTCQSHIFVSNPSKMSNFSLDSSNSKRGPGVRHGLLSSTWLKREPRIS